MAQQYRHGVLIGNWNEDQFGIERAQDPQSSGLYLSPQEHYLSVAKASYIRHSSDSVAAGRADRLKTVDRRTGVGAALLSQEQAVNDYTTTYRSLGQGQPGYIAPDHTLSKTQTVKLEKIDKVNLRETEGRGSYFTENRDNFAPQHSVLALSREEKLGLTAHAKPHSVTKAADIVHTPLRY